MSGPEPRSAQEAWDRAHPEYFVGLPYAMSVGKRLSTSDPLTEHDVAERLSRAMLRTYRLLAEVRQTEGLFGEVRRSRYFLAGLPEELAAELDRWLDADST